MKVIVSRPDIRLKGLVRDKDGHPKFDDPAKIKHFLHRLTEEDIIYLKEKYGGEYFHTDSSGA